MSNSVEANSATPGKPLAVAALIGCVLLWGSSFIAFKLALTAFHPLAIMAGRMLAATLVLAFFFKRFRGVRYQKGDWKLILLMALCEPCLYFIFEGYALKLTSASQAGMVTAMLPLMVALTARKVLKESLSTRMLLGFLLSIAGVVWLTLAGVATENAPMPILGNFLELLAMTCATGYMVLARSLSSRYNPWFLTAMQAFVGAFFYLPMLAIPAVRPVWPPPPVAWLSLLYLGVAITLGAYGLYNFGVSRIPASQATSFINLIPVITVVLGGLVLSETFTPWQYTASALVLAGVYLTQDPLAARRSRKRRPQPANT